MRTEAHGEVLKVVEMTRLTAEEVALFKDLVRATLGKHHRILEVDFSQVKTLDSEGVGALISIHKRMREQDGVVRVLRPTAFVAQMLQLLRLDQVLEVAG
jgi:anti-sigma B factor antagonist